MARPRPIIVPGPAGFGGQQTDVGVDLSGILDLLRASKERKETEALQTQEELEREALVSAVAQTQTPSQQGSIFGIAGGTPTVPTQPVEAGGLPPSREQTDVLRGLLNLDPKKFAKQARGQLFPEETAPLDTSGLFAKVNPEKFTEESLGTFQTTGDFSTLDLKKEFFPSEGDTFANESSLRKEFEAQPLVKDQVLLAGQVARMDEALTEAEAQEGKEDAASFIAVDQAIITIFNKMLDPTSVVRESEYARSAEDQGLVSRGRSLISRVQAGGRLNPVERKAIVDMARRFMTVHNKRFEANAKKFKGIAKRNKLNPEDVVIEAGKEVIEGEDQFEIIEVK
jgi:hypothetical protein